MTAPPKTTEEIAKMRVAGRLASEVLDFITPHVKPGVTTNEIDRLCHDYMVKVQDTVPAPLNYAPPGYQPYPKSVCTSVNHVVCHGVPGDKKLKTGDIVNIDVTVIKDGFHGDTSRMYYVGQPAVQARRLCDITYECMWRGIAEVRAGARLGDIGHTIQVCAETYGCSVVREFCGHGIGRKFHEEPQVLHYGRPGTGMQLAAGMTFTIEPMINAGRAGIRQLADGWTIVTKDHSLSAQWEHTVLVTDDGYEVLTVSAGAPPPPLSSMWGMASTAQPALAAASVAESTGTRLKRRLTENRSALQGRYLEHKSAPKLLREHRQVVDNILKSAWQHVGMAAGAALVAVGGYGRGELFPHSDIDLLILLPQAADQALTQTLEQFVSLLWDIGLDVGHSVRTVAECVELSAQDVTIQTSMLEARLLTGNRKLFHQFEREFLRKLDAPQFTKAKRLEQEQRHARYHDTNLEPNIKETAGGLRDLQAILWISKAAGIGTRWSDLVKREIITRREAALLRKHEAFLQNLRIRLHYLARRREERLVFDVQTALATQMGLRDTAHRRASEHLMQRFYRTAIEISQLNTIVLQNLGTLIFPSNKRAIEKINDRFHARNELLEASDEGLFRREPSAMLEAFVILQRRHELKGMTAATLRALWRASPLINPGFRRNPVNRELFMQILRSPSRVTRELKRMNQYGILGRYIPAFGHIVGQMQHDLYHVYTVDEHILHVVRNLRRFAVPELAHEYPLASRLMSDFDRPELLYLAGLFHDIAKGRGGDHSVLGKIDALRFCREHGLPRADAELVAWLVESHLVMSATAQKQDLSDPDVIAAFASRAGDDRHLVALYILTVADIRGTSPKVWNGWKAKLLEDLFWMARRRLSGEARSLDSSLQQRQDAVKAKLRLYAIKDEVTEKLWSQLDISYFLRHDVDEIAWHTRLLNYRVDTPEPVVKARLSPAGEGLQVMIYVRDQKDLFARICSFFERISYSIVDAKIYTTRHGYALDSFAILDPNNKKPQYRDLIGYVEHELGLRLANQTPLEPPAQGRLSRQLKHFPITPEVSITADERGLYKVLNIIAGDRPGLLSRVGRCLVDYQINLYTAKINTLGDRAEDVFLINGPALSDPKKVIKLESDLVRELQT